MSVQSEFLNLNKNITEVADRLIAFLDLQNILSEYGSVFFVGSYNTGLMNNFDLDINVVANNKRDSAIYFINKIISTKKIQKVQFGDFENFPRKNRPQDYIVVLIVEFEGGSWEVEIWFKDMINQVQADLESKLKFLPENIKAKIIEEKLERDKNSDKHQLPSFEIYQKYIL